MSESKPAILLSIFRDYSPPQTLVVIYFLGHAWKCKIIHADLYPCIIYGISELDEQWENQLINFQSLLDKLSRKC